VGVGRIILPNRVQAQKKVENKKQGGSENA
jgi:hypothetical protein